MNSVWHLLRSQIHALRWWLLAWAAALAAWSLGRWTYLDKFRETWPSREHLYFYALIAFSALLTSALVHLHPTARKTAAWRAWPLRSWKMAAAQFSFVIIFLVILPGAMEAAFLLHPKLSGFMGEGMTQWFLRSLWPLPIALGLAACSTSLRRFLLDAVLFCAAVTACYMLERSAIGRTLLAMHNSSWGAYLFPWFLFSVLGIALIHWSLSAWKGLAFIRTARCALLMAPFIWFGCTAYLNRTTPRVLSFREWHFGRQSTTAEDVASRISVSITPGTVTMSDYSSLQHLTGQVELSGLAENEYADLIFSNVRLERNGLAFLERKELNWWQGRFGGSLGNVYWTPFSSPNSEADRRLAMTHSLIPLEATDLPALKLVAFDFYGIANTSVTRQVLLGTLPLIEGSVLNLHGAEAIVEFVATTEASAAAAAGKPDSRTIVRLTMRAYGSNARQGYIFARLVHKPDGRMINGYTGRQTSGLFGYSGSRTDQQEFGGSIHDPNLHLIRKAITEPGDFELAILKLENAGAVRKEVRIENITLPSK